MRKSPGSRPRPTRPNHGATAARMTSTTRTVSSHFNMIELYTWSTPNGRKVSIMLEECGLPYRVHKIDIGKGDQFTPEYVAINPKSEYFSQEYSIADIAIYPWVARHEWHRVDLSDYPNVKRWYEGIGARPAVARGMAVPALN